MATARKDVADYINDKAMRAGECLYESITSEPGKGPSQTQITAAKAILDKVIPNLKAIDQSVTVKGDIKATVDLGG